MDEFYVIILDSDINNPTDWEYVVRKKTLPEIEKETQYSPDDRQAVSRIEYAGEEINDKSVISVKTGNPASGKIYRLNKRLSNLAMVKTIALALLILITLTACPTPELTKRYAKADFFPLKTEAVERYVTIEVASYPVTGITSQHKVIFDLADHGQQAYVTALAEKEKDTDSFLSKLSRPLENKQPTAIDQAKFARKLVFSIKNNTDKPANRIDSIVLALTLKHPDKVKFSTWNRIVTDYQNIDIGKLTFGQTSSFAFAPEITTATGASAKLGTLSYGKSLQEEVGIKDT